MKNNFDLNGYFDETEQRLGELKVNVFGIKHDDAYMRCLELLDRCEARISNLMVKLQENGITEDDDGSSLQELQ